MAKFVCVTGMKSREERVLHGEVRPEIAKTTTETEQIEEEPEVFYDRVRINHMHIKRHAYIYCTHIVMVTCKQTWVIIRMYVIVGFY